MCELRLGLPRLGLSLFRVRGYYHDQPLEDSSLQRYQALPRRPGPAVLLSANPAQRERQTLRFRSEFYNTFNDP